MSVVIRERIATAADVAKAHGVSKARLKWLVGLLDRKAPNGRRRRGRNPATGSPVVIQKVRKSNGSRKARSRGKAAR